MEYKGGQPAPGFMPPPPYPGQPSMQSSPAVVVVRQQALGPESQRMICPNCQANISTRVEPESTSRTHLFALILCLVGLWCCAPLPYCTDSCLAKKHYCPNCQTYLGQYEN